MNDKIDSTIEHKILNINGNSIHYFVSGNENGETVLFLHPAFGDHRCFDRQVDFFSQNYCVITIDMLGHGLTGAGKSFTVMSGLNEIIKDRADIQWKYPLLILVGDKDSELAIKSAQQWYGDSPDSQFYIVENAGHCANMDNAVKFNDLLMNFITAKQ
ncbi:MAG: alpha/beta hydrolase [Dysgonamonadaceae bacterium]|nr:alpha/beta hydrolase [Dysgonamonadaceae bacterium]